MTLNIEAWYSLIPHNLGPTVMEKVLTTRSTNEIQTNLVGDLRRFLLAN